jgi:hypothetical protein
LKNTRTSFGAASAVRKEQSQIAARMTVMQQCPADIVAY